MTIPLVIFDVDGVLTDGRLMPASDGDTSKMFCSQDGHAMKLWRKQGRRIAVISGRKSVVVETRCAELGVDLVHLGHEEKKEAFEKVLHSSRVDAQQAAYVGDDLPDIDVMRRCGVPMAVANALPPVKRAALYVTRRGGGDSAAAECIEWLLRLDGSWSQVYGRLC